MPLTISLLLKKLIISYIHYYYGAITIIIIFIYYNIVIFIYTKLSLYSKLAHVEVNMGPTHEMPAVVFVSDDIRKAILSSFRLLRIACSQLP
jgi:hypothetical protein